MTKNSLWKIANRANGEGTADPCRAIKSVLQDYPFLKVRGIENTGNEINVFVRHGKQEIIFSHFKKGWEV